jgi:hypothetical protein
MTDLLEERLVTYVRGPKGEAGIFEAFEPLDAGEEDSLSAVILPSADGALQKLRLTYVVRLRESVRQSFLSLGEAYLAAGDLAGVEAGIGHNPGRHLAD